MGRFDRGVPAQDLTDEQLAQALAAYAAGATPTRAAMAAETNRFELLKREKDDPEFAEAVVRAREAGHDYIEEQLLRKGGANAMVKVLQWRKPEYRDSVKVEHTVVPPTADQLEEARKLGEDPAFRLAAHTAVDKYLNSGDGAG